MSTNIGFRDSFGPPGSAPGVKETFPLNPFKLVTRTVNVPVDAGAIEIESVLAEITKSTTLTITLIECVAEPPLPVTVTLYVPGGVFAAKTDRADETESPEVNVAFFGARSTPSPRGETAADSVMLPEKPLEPLRVRVKPLEALASTVSEL